MFTVPSRYATQPTGTKLRPPDPIPHLQHPHLKIPSHPPQTSPPLPALPHLQHVQVPAVQRAAQRHQPHQRAPRPRPQRRGPVPRLQAGRQLLQALQRVGREVGVVHGVAGGGVAQRQHALLRVVVRGDSVQEGEAGGRKREARERWSACPSPLRPLRRPACQPARPVMCAPQAWSHRRGDSRGPWPCMCPAQQPMYSPSTRPALITLLPT